MGSFMLLFRHNDCSCSGLVLDSLEPIPDVEYPASMCVCMLVEENFYLENMESCTLLCHKLPYCQSLLIIQEHPGYVPV